MTITGVPERRRAKVHTTPTFTVTRTPCNICHRTAPGEFHQEGKLGGRGGQLRDRPRGTVCPRLHLLCVERHSRRCVPRITPYPVDLHDRRSTDTAAVLNVQHARRCCRLQVHTLRCTPLLPSLCARQLQHTSPGPVIGLLPTCQRPRTFGASSPGTGTGLAEREIRT